MSIKSTLLLCGAAALAAMVPSAASARGVFSISIGSGYGGYSGYNNGYSGYNNGYSGYGYSPYGQNGYSQYGRHAQQHDQIDDEHEDGHDQLDEEHQRAHAQGIDPWQDRRLHRELRREHKNGDRQLERQHEYQHRLDEWRRNYSNGGYYGY